MIVLSDTNLRKLGELIVAFANNNAVIHSVTGDPAPLTRGDTLDVEYLIEHITEFNAVFLPTTLTLRLYQTEYGLTHSLLDPATNTLISTKRPAAAEDSLLQEWILRVEGSV